MVTEYGMGRGNVFPASKARSLLNPARRLVQSPGRIVRALGVDTCARVLEVGCGPGYFSPAVSAAVPDGQLVLADLQLPMLLHARRRTSARLNVRLVQLDATGLAFHSGAFDAVVVVLMLGEVPDREACLSELRRVLRPGGVALFAESRRDGDFIRRAELRELVEAHGFELDQLRGWSYEYTARFLAVEPT